MTRKTVIVALTTILFCLSIIPLTSLAAPESYDLLIIAPYEFKSALIPLKNFKDATGRPTIILSLEDIYANPAFDGADEAEEVKKCIAYFQQNYGVKYVMLVGDCDRLPIRTFYVKTEDKAQVTWLAHYVTDHYYADLFYEGTTDFCDWDYDGDGLYGECRKYEDSFLGNIDHVDFYFDVAVGRVPASSVDEVETYVNKVIQYELTATPDASWFKRILLLTGVGGGRYAAPDDVDLNDYIAFLLTPLGFTAIKLYNESGYTQPSPTTINNQLNSGVGFVNVVCHCSRTSWDDIYSAPGDMNGLNNAGKLPVIYCFGCHSAGFAPIAPFDPYVDVNGVQQSTIYRPGDFPIDKSVFVEPPLPDPIQTSATDVEAMPEYWLVRSDVGAVAYIGSTAEAIKTPGFDINKHFFKSYASGKNVLGDIWLEVCKKYIDQYKPSDDWEYFRRWLFMNVFGDPSLIIGGLSDKPPTTTKSLGDPNYSDGVNLYVTSATPHTLTVTDDSPSWTTYYRYYPEGSPPPSWTTYTGPFTITGADGPYIIEFYSEDSSGNREVSINSQREILDNTPPETTLEVGSPSYTDGGNTYITSATLLTLSASDGTGSGVLVTKYRVNTGPWTTYTGAFTITGSDGAYTIEYYSVDNLGNEETPKSLMVILDNTPPETSLTVGSPQYVDGVNLYVSSTTPFTLSASDGAGSGVNRIEYRVNGGAWTTYTDPFTISGPDGTYVIEYRSVDNLGNEETPKSVTVILDATPPAISIVSPEPKAYSHCTTESITIDFEVTDTGSGVAEVHAELNGMPVNDGDVIDIYRLRWGIYTLTVTARDNLGQVSTSSMTFSVVHAVGGIVTPVNKTGLLVSWAIPLMLASLGVTALVRCRRRR